MVCKLKPMRVPYAISSEIVVDPQSTGKTCLYETINLVSRTQNQLLDVAKRRAYAEECS
jgi:hypothetical protein